jgi:hypothetical protein
MGSFPLILPILTLVLAFGVLGGVPIFPEKFIDCSESRFERTSDLLTFGMWNSRLK